MSKIGRKPIDISKVTVTVAGNIVAIKGSKAQFNHELPACLVATVDSAAKNIVLGVTENTRKIRTLWGMHRAVIANKVQGAGVGLEQKVKLVGLGYKGQLVGSKIVFTVGFSHKVEVEVPQGITIEIDKTGQLITVRGADKFVIGNVCDAMRSVRPPEPYKGTGIMRENEVIVRKAGKTKS